MPFAPFAVRRLGSSTPPRARKPGDPAGNRARRGPYSRKTVVPALASEHAPSAMKQPYDGDDGAGELSYSIRVGRSNEALFLGGGLEDLIALGCARNEPFAPFQLEHHTVVCIISAHGGERRGNLLGQGLLHVAVGGKATVAVARAAPEDPDILVPQLALLSQRRQGIGAHGASIVVARLHQRDDTGLSSRPARWPVLGEGGKGEIL